MKARASQPKLVHPEFKGVQLSPADAAAGLALSTEAKWNQTAADWTFLLETGMALGFEDSAGELVASAVILPYEGKIGWICMVLVSARARRRGLARNLLALAIDLARDANLTPMLDATPDGRTVYVGIGFRDLFPITRWIGLERPAQLRAEPTNPEIHPLLSDAGLERWRQWDQTRFGAERGALLELFQRSRPDLALQVGAGEGRGYCLGRVGRKRPQIGPVGADSIASALVLLKGAIDRVGDFAFVDLVEGYPEIEAFLAARGWKRQRAFTRMIIGELPAVRPEGLYVIGGPEFG